ASAATPDSPAASASADGLTLAGTYLISASSYRCQRPRPFCLPDGPLDLLADRSPTREQLVGVQKRDEPQAQIALDGWQTPPLDPDKNVAVAGLDQPGHGQRHHRAPEA